MPNGASLSNPLLKWLRCKLLLSQKLILLQFSWKYLAITVLFSTFRVKSIPRKFIKSLYKNPRVMFLHKFMWIILLVTYLIAYLINPIVLLYLAALLPISFVSFGLINFFGHDENGPTNKWWINIFAPFEGNHYDHHT